MKLTKAQGKEFKEISKFFLEATDVIEDPYLRATVSAKILSRLSCFADRLGGRRI